jgi:hypothetical protein
VLSLANSVVGALDAAVLSVHAIGRGYAHAIGGNEKHGLKQTDRLLSNRGVDVWSLFSPWASFVVGERKDVVVALDWTEFDMDDHATLAGYLITSHGARDPVDFDDGSEVDPRGQANCYGAGLWMVAQAA